MAVNTRLIPTIATRQGMDEYIASIAGQYPPEQVNEIAQRLSANNAGVSFQEIQGRLADNAAYPQQSFQGTGTASGGSAYNPDTDPGLLNPVKQQLSQKIAAINALYDALYGDLGTLYQSKRGELDQNYQGERDKSTKAYEETARILPTQYASQGIRYSSYYENADKKAGDSYKEGLGELEKGYNQNLGQLGSAYNQQKTAFDVGRQQLGQIDPNAYGSVSQAQGSLQNLNSLEGQLAQQRAGLGTNSSYIQSLNQIAPSKSTVPDALKKQLEELSTTSIPGSAKATIANGIIKQAGTGQDTYWTDYFNKLLSGQGQTTSPLG